MSHFQNDSQHDSSGKNKSEQWDAKSPWIICLLRIKELENTGDNALAKARLNEYDIILKLNDGTKKKEELKKLIDKLNR